MLIATAGHVDHGKTTLINALTGVDTDRLPEEKKRGLTIELGFAYLSNDVGISLGFIDVPGHEKFIRTMASGVSAVDLALLVIAADDGIMPQTLEHIAILELFGVPNCIVAITRIDLVENQQVELLADQINATLAKTQLKCKHVIPTSAPTNVGIDELKHALFESAQEVKNGDKKNGETKNRDSEKQEANHAEDNHYFRMAVDRSFTIRGSGTVVTGTVIAGRIKIGDSIVLLPGNKKSRIRAIHANSQAAEQVSSGYRAALNLTNIETTDAPRGSWVTSEEQQTASTCMDMRLRLLGTESKPLKHWSPVHIHSGAASTTARVALYDVRTLSPGEENYAQLVLDKPMHMLFGDKLIVRDQSASRTIAGAMIIDPHSSRQRGFRKNRWLKIKSQDHPNTSTALKRILAISPDGVNAENFRLARNISVAKFNQIIQKLDATTLANYNANTIRSKSSSKSAHSSSQNSVGHLFDVELLNGTRKIILESLQQYHHDQPQSNGIEVPLLWDTIKENRANPDNEGSADLAERAALLTPAPLAPTLVTHTLFTQLIEQLIRNNELARTGIRLKRDGHTAELSESQKTLLEKVMEVVGPDEMKPPSLSALATHLAMKTPQAAEILLPLVQSGHLTQVARNRFIHPQALERLTAIARDLSIEHAPEGFDAKTYRDSSGIGRNITIDILEYFDAAGLTRRTGDKRMIRQ